MSENALAFPGNPRQSGLPAILHTSCVIVSDHSVALQDKDVRIKHTLESIEKWLQVSRDLPLVICDGSNFDFTPVVQQHFPNAKIECLFFQNTSTQVVRNGKGYGEGEIINYALNHSAFIQEAGFFAKCTAKLWVENFLECLDCWNGSLVCKGYFSNVFSLRKTRFSYVDTRFFLASRTFYLENLAQLYLKVGGEKWLSIEDCFHDALIEHGYTKVLFNVPPVICGMGGGTGKYYKNNFKRRLKERLRLWLVRRDRRFSSLFV